MTSFLYAGIHRPVLLFATPDVHIHDLTVKTAIAGRGGKVVVDLADVVELERQGECADQRSRRRGAGSGQRRRSVADDRCAERAAVVH